MADYEHFLHCNTSTNSISHPNTCFNWLPLSQSYLHHIIFVLKAKKRERGLLFRNNSQIFLLMQRKWSSAGPNEYPRVLDYSIFKSLLVPYSENFTSRPSSQVVVIFTIFVRTIEISRKWKSNTFYQMCLSFKISSAPKGTFLWDEIYSLPYLTTGLLNFEVTTLPYPARS